jgi:hypothetical protein
VAVVSGAARFIPYQLVRIVAFAAGAELDLVVTHEALWSLLVYPAWHSALATVLA